jgi:hypothetical protein
MSLHNAAALILVGLLALLVPVLLIGLPIFFLVRANKKKTSLGINLQRVDCPECGMALPRVRKPANFRQAMFGGWTCPDCATEIDKWGRLLKSGTLE